MTGNSLALDTNAAIAVLSGEQSASEIVKQFDTVCLPVPVVGELRYGALNSARPEENLAVIERLAAHCIVLPADEQTATIYAQVRAGLKKRGRPIPENDVWIAATCLQRAIPLATRDAHFREIDGLQAVAV